MKKTFSRKKTTLWNIFNLYLANGIGLIRGLLIIPLYLYYIDPKLYGAWLATGNILMWLTLFDPGVGDVAIQKIAESYGSNSKREIIKYQISSSVIISFIISFIVIFIGVFGATLLLKTVITTHEIDFNNLSTAFDFAIFSTAITLFSFSLTGSIIGLQRTKQLGFIRNSSNVLGIIINVVLLMNGLKLIALSFSMLFASFFSLIAYAFLLIRIINKEKIGYGINIKFLANYSKIFTFTFMSKISDTLARNIDLILVGRFVGLEQVTVLSLTRRPLKFITQFITTPSIGMLPTISNLYGSRDNEKLKTVVLATLKLLFLSIIIGASGFALFNGNFIALWVGKKFYLGDTLNLIIAITFLTKTFSYVVYNYTFSLGAIKESSVFDFIKNIIWVFTIFISSYLWGIKGLLIGTLVVSIFTELWFYPKLLIKRLNISIKDILLEFWPLLKITFFMLVFYLVLFNYNDMNIFSTWKYFILSVLVYLVIISIATYFLYPDIILFVKKYIIKKPNDKKVIK